MVPKPVKYKKKFLHLTGLVKVYVDNDHSHILIKKKGKNRKL